MKHLLLATIPLLPLAAAATPPLPDADFVYVTGQARLSLPPDGCTVDASVKAVGADPRTAALSLRQAAADVMATAKRLGVELPQVDGSDLNRSIPYSERQKARPETTRAFRFRLGQVPQCVQLADALVATAGVTELSVRFVVADEAAAEDKAMAQAVAEASRRAQQLAGLVGRKVAKAIAVSEEPMDAVAGRFGGLSLRVGLAAPFVPPAPAPDELAYAVPKAVTFSKSVYVMFRLD